MSAFVGLFHRDGAPARAETLQPMIDILSHRGTDWVGNWLKGPVGLGNRMLFTTQSSRGERMPAADPSGDLVITADARLDNRDELWRQLGREGRPGDEVTDSELILDAYRQWGDDCARRLLGDFAFMIWDGRRRRMLCVRDPMGVKPFYYHCSDRIFAAASEIKAILQLKSVGRQLDEIWIGDYLTNRWTDKTHTIYCLIRRLAPAYTMIVDSGGMLTKCYWKLDPTRELHMNSEEEYLEGFRELFFDAVRCRMRSSFPIGSMLSGGLDSSSITCVARHLNESREPLPTFSALFPATPKSDEGSFINNVIAQNGVLPHCIDLSPVGTLYDYERKAWHLDQPMTGYNSHIRWTLLRHAHDLGVRVILDGTDGDSTISYGNGYLRDLAMGRRWATLIAELRNYQVIHDTPFWNPLLYFLWQYGCRPYVPMKLKSLWRSVGIGCSRSKRQQDNDVFWKSFQTDFVRRSNLKERLEAYARQRKSNTAREEHWKSIDSASLRMLLDLLDHLAAAFGVEQRLPFCDRRLVEYCLALPTNMKVRGGLDRYILRRALNDILPDIIVKRPNKTDLSFVFHYSLKNHDSNIIEELLASPMVPIKSFINISHVRDMYSRFSAGTSDILENYGMWRIVALSLWMEKKMR